MLTDIIVMNARIATTKGVLHDMWIPRLASMLMRVAVSVTTRILVAITTHHVSISTIILTIRATSHGTHS